MRLLTHNYLQSNVKGTDKGYPLIIEATDVVVEETPVNRDMIHAVLPKLEYAALVSAARQLAATTIASTTEQAEGDHEETTEGGGGGSAVTVPDLPDQVPSMPLDDETVEKLHRVLFDIHVLSGHLVCPDTGRRFPINDGIPNMILHEDEL